MLRETNKQNPLMRSCTCHIDAIIGILADLNLWVGIHRWAHAFFIAQATFKLLLRKCCILKDNILWMFCPVKKAHVSLLSSLNN